MFLKVQVRKSCCFVHLNVDVIRMFLKMARSLILGYQSDVHGTSINIGSGERRGWIHVLGPFWQDSSCIFHVLKMEFGGVNPVHLCFYVPFRGED